jgi:hypothetical protein
MLRFGVPYEEGFSLEGDEYRVGVDCVWKFVMRCFGDPLLVALICLEGEERMVGCLGFGGGSSALDDLLYCLKIFFRLGARDGTFDAGGTVLELYSMSCSCCALVDGIVRTIGGGCIRVSRLWLLRGGFLSSTSVDAKSYGFPNDDDDDDAVALLVRSFGKLESSTITLPSSRWILPPNLPL